MALDGAIASACGLEGIRVDPAMVEVASELAVAAFAPDIAYRMIETLCGGEPATVVARGASRRGDDRATRCRFKSGLKSRIC